MLVSMKENTGRLNKAAATTTEAQNYHHELTLPNIHLNYEWLEHVQVPDLQIQSCRLSMIQGNNRIFKRSPSGGPVSRV